MKSDLGHRNLAYRTEVQRARQINMADAHPISPASFYLCTDLVLLLLLGQNNMSIRMWLWA